MKRKLIFILISFILLCFTNVNFAQAPDLGTASSFALFTAAGAFDNAGATSVSGDIGTNVGAFSGFPPGTVVGQIHVADLTSAQAAIDVDVAYNYLKGVSCDSVIGTTLGDNQILTPKVYCIGAISILNGDLVLDGQGDPNALFIFQIDGAFSTSTISNVTLINSVSPNNVYWQINGAFDLGDSSVFKGNIVANGAISLLGSSSLIGRGLSRSGAIYLNDNFVSIETPILPIELLSFIAYQTGADIKLDWSTASETNNDYFTVQRSKDGIYFEEVLRMKGAGNSNKVLHYSNIDNNPYNGISYYILKQTDFDGKLTYSNLVAVDIERTFDYNIYPNPFNTAINIIINDTSQIIKAEFSMFNVLGAEVMNTAVTNQLITIETTNLSSGLYFYKVTDNNKTIQSGRLVSKQ